MGGAAFAATITFHGVFGSGRSNSCVAKSRFRKRLDDIARCARRENILRHSHTVHALLREKADNDAAARFENAVDLGKACIE